MVSDLPEPCVCQTTPTRLSPGRRRAASWRSSRRRSFNAIAPALARADGFGHGDVDGVELVIARQLLDDAIAAVVLKHDEMPDEVEKTALVKHAAQQDFQLRTTWRARRFRLQWCATA